MIATPSPIYIQPQPRLVHTFTAGCPTFETIAPLYTREPAHLLPGVPYTTISCFHDAYMQFEAERRSGLRSAWRVQRRVYLRGAVSQQAIWSAVQAAWLNHDLLLLADDYVGLIAGEAARHYVVPFVVAGRNLHPRCRATAYERVLGDVSEYLRVLADVVREV